MKMVLVVMRKVGYRPRLIVSTAKKKEEKEKKREKSLFQEHIHVSWPT